VTAGVGQDGLRLLLQAKGSPLCGRQAVRAGCIVGLGCWGTESFF